MSISLRVREVLPNRAHADRRGEPKFSGIAGNKLCSALQSNNQVYIQSLCSSKLNTEYFTYGRVSLHGLYSTKFSQWFLSVARAHFLCGYLRRNCAYTLFYISFETPKSSLGISNGEQDWYVCLKQIYDPIYKCSYYNELNIAYIVIFTFLHSIISMINRLNVSGIIHVCSYLEKNQKPSKDILSNV